MGGAVSTGQDNDDLIDNLLEANYIRTKTVERVFRAVDRAEYFLGEARGNAYKDLAWKFGNLHLSAPCIYSEVMEGLHLSPGLSFLNLGSGTGYLSTMVGLILGSSGINHGVEIHEDVIQYANKKLEDFKKYSGAIDEYDFCEPKFIQGNCLCLTNETQYDRVYCGAACPESYENYMKNLLRVGGILVMPLNDHLVQIKRTSEFTWDSRSLLPVSFATLIQPPEGKEEWVKLLPIEPQSLQALCRTVIRNFLRADISATYGGDIKKRPPVTKRSPRKKRTLRRLVVPLFDTSDDNSTDEENGPISARRRDLGRVHVFDNSRDVGSLIDIVLGRIRERSGNHLLGNRQEPPNEGAQSNDNAKTEEAQENMEVEGDIVEVNGTSESTENLSKQTNGGAEVNQEVEAIIEHNPSMNNPEQNNPNNDRDNEDENEMVAIGEIGNVFIGVFNELRKVRGILDDDEEEEDETENVAAEEQQKTAEVKASTSTEDHKKNNREKFDSGLGDEIIETQNTMSSESSDVENCMEFETNSGSDDDQEERPNKRSSKPQTYVRTGAKWRKITVNRPGFLSDSSSDNDNNEEKETQTAADEVRVMSSVFSTHMRRKIQELPLPTILKNYLNFYRDF